MLEYCPGGRASLLSQEIGSGVVGSGLGKSVTFWGSRAGHHLAYKCHCLSFLERQKTLMFPQL